MSNDNKSFIASVTSSALVNAGITPPPGSGTSGIIIVVSHGDWAASSLPISQGGGDGASTTTSAPDINWIISMAPNISSAPNATLYEPGNACFVG